MTNASILALANVLLVLLDNRTLGTLSAAPKARQPRLSLLESLPLNDLHLLGLEGEYVLLGERLLLGLRTDERNQLLAALKLLGLDKRGDLLLLLAEARGLLLLQQQFLPERLQGQLLLQEDLRSMDRLLPLLTSVIEPKEALSSWELSRTPNSVSVAHMPR